MEISFRAIFAMKGGPAMKINMGRLAAALIMLSVLGWNGMVQAGDVEIYLPLTNSDFNVIQGSNNRFHVGGNGYVGIGTNTPARYLHVRGDDNIAKFATTSTASRALLDLDAPNVAVGNLSRLTWRSNSSTGVNKQFGAIDLIYTDKTNSSEDAHMAFSTIKLGTMTEAMRIEGNCVGIGTTNPNSIYNLDVRKNANSEYVALFANENTGDTAGVLRLRVGRGYPLITNHFIRFEYGSGLEVGSITGNSGGGVTYNTTAADFAEYLPLRERGERIEAGDIVGIFGGTVSRTTLGTDRVRVISSAPALLGNTPPKDQIDHFRKVAFIGQVPVKIRGAVQAGDYVVPSGLHDGIGVAVAPDNLRPAQYGQVVGVSSGSSSDESVKMVVIEVGLHTAAKQLADFHEQKDRQISDLIQATQALQKRLEVLEKAFSRMNPEPNLASLRRE